MTIWQPDLGGTRGPLYLAIADAIAADVQGGRLRDGDRLPPQRELAHRLGVTLGTVTRGYAEARRRGLLVGETGRGSYVTTRPLPGVSAALARREDVPRDVIDLTLTRPAGSWLAEALTDGLASLAADGARHGLLAPYGAVEGRAEHREAGAAWLQQRGVPAGPDRVCVTAGAQNALALSAFGLLRNGDRVLVEELTYPGFKALAVPMGLRLEPVAIDRDGLVPEALEAALASHPARALYLMPTLHNPTMRTLPEARRRAIAAIAERHDLLLIEDEVYGFLEDRPRPRLAALAPDRTIYVASPSKFLPPGLRVGFLAAPQALMPRLAQAQRAMSWMASPVTTEVVCRWIADGTMARMIERQRAEAVDRLAMARAALPDLVEADCRAAMHVWLPLPAPWRRQDFVEQAIAHGVAITSADTFAVGRGQAPHAVRFGLGTPERAELARALDILARLLRDSPAMGVAVV